MKATMTNVAKVITGAGYDIKFFTAYVVVFNVTVKDVQDIFGLLNSIFGEKQMDKYELQYNYENRTAVIIKKKSNVGVIV